MKRRTFVGAATGLAALGTLGSPAFGQAKITGDVRFLCGFAPGGNADLLCRLVAESARPDIGQNIIVENKTGAGGFIANETLANAPPPSSSLPPLEIVPEQPVPRASAGGTRMRRLLTVAIDPGHGGEDPGAIGPSGLREKDVVLAIARETAALDAAAASTACAASLKLACFRRRASFLPL